MPAIMEEEVESDTLDLESNANITSPLNRENIPMKSSNLPVAGRIGLEKGPIMDNVGSDERVNKKANELPIASNWQAQWVVRMSKIGSTTRCWHLKS